VNIQRPPLPQGEGGAVGEKAQEPPENEGVFGGDPADAEQQLMKGIQRDP
jgi:hypothetical protein